MKRAFEPRGARTWLDTILGVATGFLWDDLGMYKSKKGVRDAERIVEEWNKERRRENLASSVSGAAAAATKEDGADTEADVVRCVELRRTGFLCLDFVIPDPKVAVVGSEAEVGGTRPTTAGLSLPGPEERKEEGGEDEGKDGDGRKTEVRDSGMIV